MAHYKRKKPKSARSGCLLCKPHKRQGSCLVHRVRFADRRRSLPNWQNDARSDR